VERGKPQAAGDQGVGVVPCFRKCCAAASAVSIAFCPFRGWSKPGGRPNRRHERNMGAARAWVVAVGGVMVVIGFQRGNRNGAARAGAGGRHTGGAGRPAPEPWASGPAVGANEQLPENWTEPPSTHVATAHARVEGERDRRGRAHRCAPRRNSSGLTPVGLQIHGMRTVAAATGCRGGVEPRQTAHRPPCRAAIIEATHASARAATGGTDSRRRPVCARPR